MVRLRRPQRHDHVAVLLEQRLPLHRRAQPRVVRKARYYDQRSPLLVLCLESLGAEILPAHALDAARTLPDLGSGNSGSRGPPGRLRRTAAATALLVAVGSTLCRAICAPVYGEGAQRQQQAAAARQQRLRRLPLPLLLPHPARLLQLRHCAGRLGLPGGPAGSQHTAASQRAAGGGYRARDNTRVGGGRAPAAYCSSCCTAYR